jgi:hypothetical protein
MMQAQFPSHVEVSDQPLDFLISESSLMIYSGSTVCIDALAVGLPVVHLRPTFDLDMDPLGEELQARLDAMGLEDLREKVRWLLEHREEYIAQHQEQWGRLVKDMYGPVTDESYLTFVETGVR